MQKLSRVVEVSVGRQTSEGAKTLVWAALAGHDDPAVRERLRGAYSSDCKIAEEGDFVLSKDGHKSEARIWVSMFGQFIHRPLLIEVPLSGRNSSDLGEGGFTSRRDS
jgi:hypothetical protein